MQADKLMQQAAQIHLDAKFLLKNRNIADTRIRQEVLKHFTDLGIAPLANLRAGMRARMKNSPLMDGAGFTRIIQSKTPA